MEENNKNPTEYFLKVKLDAKQKLYISEMSPDIKGFNDGGIKIDENLVFTNQADPRINGLVDFLKLSGLKLQGGGSNKRKPLKKKNSTKRKK